uniref:BPI2 domain-containing protein n=1 Tax=Angiostrongylus cantonensis TaxID=6313 RepID=A0A0K0DEJ3_ANGCA
MPIRCFLFRFFSNIKIRISTGLVEYEGPRISIPPSQLCFPEGCVQIHSLRMVNFRQPSTVSFDPYPPNRFIIRVMDFDFLSQLEISRNSYEFCAGISVTAYMDIQKTSNDQPYFRMLSCQIDGGIVNAKVANMGLITDLVNMRFRDVMTSHSRAQLEKAICENIYRLTQTHFSSRLSIIPRQLPISELFKLFLSVSRASPKHSNRILRSKRATDDYYDDVEGNTPQKFLLSSSQERLRHIWIDLTLLDASATHNDFTVGMSGTVSNSRRNDVSPYRVPFPFRLPQSSQRRMVEVMISDYVINSVLYHAHRFVCLI